jgi:hypothetical protein
MIIRSCFLHDPDLNVSVLPGRYAYNLIRVGPA